MILLEHPCLQKGPARWHLAGPLPSLGLAEEALLEVEQGDVRDHRAKDRGAQ